uniref:c-type cytochrome domain-containing protein n=1 Tax=Stieleria sp. TaxID=2795976 RepID=UPI003562F796
MLRIRLPAIVMVLLAASSSLRGADSPLDFQSQVAPILQRHCIRCHSPNNNQGELSLATSDDLRANEYVIAGDPESSYLLELITSTDGQPAAMPKESNPLSDGEVALIRQWIVQGAAWPSDVVVKEQSKADETWWSLQPLRVAKRMPSDSNISDAPPSPATIDAFIRAKLADKQLEMNPPADRRTLIRR